MNMEDLIKQAIKNIEEVPEGIDHQITLLHTTILAIHTKALSAHCECLGMNAENCAAACINTTPPYNDDHYLQVVKKWGLMDEKGEPLI
jgi:hypothetical protein